MAWVFTINSVDRSSIVIGSNVEESMFGADVATILLDNGGGTYDTTFTHGMPVLIQIDATIKFTGSIENVRINHQDGSLQLDCREKIGEFMEIFPIESEYKDKLRSFILDDLMSKYARDIDITNIDSSPIGSEITTSFKGGKSLFEILDDFALEEGYRYYIINSAGTDYLYYTLKEDVTSVLTLDDTSDEIFSIEYPQVGQDIKNRVHIYGTQNQRGTINSIGAYSGGQTVITVGDVNGTYQAGAYYDGLFVFTDPDSGRSGSAYRIVDNGDDSSNDTFTLDGDASVATGGQVTTDTYNLPILWEGNDSISQVYKGNASNDPDSTNPLIKAAQIVDNTIKTPLQAQKRSKEFLDQHAWKLDIYKVSANADDYDTLNTGELISTTLDSYVTAENMLVTALAWDYFSNIVVIELTFWEKDLERTVAELIKRQRGLDTQIIESLDIALKTANVLDEIEIEDAVRIYRYEPADTLEASVVSDQVGHPIVWADSDYGYRRKAIVPDVSEGEQCVLDFTDITDSMQSDNDDIRLYEADGTAIGYYVSSEDIYFIAPRDNPQVYVYYGYGSAVSGSDYFGGVINTVDLTKTHTADTNCIACYHMDHHQQQALDFDGWGSGDGINVGDHSELDMGTGDMSFCAWILYDNHFNNPSRVLSKGAFGESGGYGISVANGINNDYLLFQVETSTPVTKYAESNEEIIVDEWTHIACVRDASETDGLKMYINGTEVTYSTQEDASTLDIASSGFNFMIGDQHAGLTNEWYGKLTDIRVFDNVLTSTEIIQIMRGENIQTNDLIGWWDFEYINGTTVYDLSSSGNNGTCTGGVESNTTGTFLTDCPTCGSGIYHGDFKDAGEPKTVGTDGVKFGGNKAMWFDGTDDEITNATYLDVVPAAINFAFWFCVDETFDSGAGTDMFLVWKKNITDDDRLNIRLEADDGKLTFQTEENANVHTDLDSTTATWTGGQWYHAVLTWDTTNGKRIFVNGALEATDAGETTLMSNGTGDDFTLGNRAAGGWYGGKMAELVTYHEVLSVADVMNIYKGNYSDAGTPQLYYNFKQLSDLHSLYFGGDSYITNTDNLSATEISFAFWINAYNTGGTNNIIRQIGGDYAINVFVDNIEIWDDDAWTNIQWPLAEDTWTHVVVTRSSSAYYTLYMDGVERGSGQGTGTFELNGFEIGTDNWNQYLEGRLADFRIWHKELTATDAVDVMNGDITVQSGDLKVLYDFKDATATTAIDSSGNSYDGTITNALKSQDCYDLSGNSNDGTVISAIETLGDYPFTGNYCLEFDGVDDYVYSEIGAMSAYTIGFWMKTTTDNKGMFIHSGTLPADTQHDKQFYLVSGKVRFRIWDGAESLVDSTTDVIDGNWHHIVGSGETDGVQKIYVDGILEDSIGLNTVWAGGVYAVFGYSVNGSGPGNIFLDGEMDDCRIWNKVLSGLEVQQAPISKFSSTL